MRSLLMVAVGVWIGRGIYISLAKNQTREKEVTTRKALDKFMQERIPTLTVTQRKSEIDTILKN